MAPFRYNQFRYHQSEIIIAATASGRIPSLYLNLREFGERQVSSRHRGRASAVGEGLTRG